MRLRRKIVQLRLVAYRSNRNGRESFIDTLRRVGFEPFKAAANSARLTDKHEDLHTLPKAQGYARDAQEA